MEIRYEAKGNVRIGEKRRNKTTEKERKVKSCNDRNVKEMPR